MLIPFDFFIGMVYNIVKKSRRGEKIMKNTNKKVSELKKEIYQAKGMKAEGHWESREIETLIDQVIKARSQEEGGRLQAKSE